MRLRSRDSVAGVGKVERVPTPWRSDWAETKLCELIGRA